MIIAEVVQSLAAAAHASLAAYAQAGLAEVQMAIGPLAQEPTSPTDINTEGVISFLLSKIAPIFLAVLGLIFIGRAGKGEVSKVVTSSAIAIVGLAFIAGAVALIFLGELLVDLLFV